MDFHAHGTGNILLDDAWIIADGGAGGNVTAAAGLAGGAGGAAGEVDIETWVGNITVVSIPFRIGIIL